MASFWDTIGPGLLETGVGLFGERRKAQQQQKLLEQARGPLYDTQQALAGRSLALARSTDPKAVAAERFGAQQSLVAPSNEAAMNNLMQMLQSRGLLGLSSYSAVPGTAQTPGVPVNPYVASLLAAQEGAKSKSAYQSLAEGEEQLDRLIERGGALQRGAQSAQQSGIGAVSAKLLTPKPRISDALLRGGMSILKDPRARNNVWDLIKKVPGLFGGSQAYSAPGFVPQAWNEPAYDYSFDF